MSRAGCRRLVVRPRGLVTDLRSLPRSLDLSFNLLRSVAPLDDASPTSAYHYPHLTHLYLIQNKLTQIQGVRDRTSLTYLEYGGNRIRVSTKLVFGTSSASSSPS